MNGLGLIWECWSTNCDKLGTWKGLGLGLWMLLSYLSEKGVLWNIIVERRWSCSSW